MSFLDRERAAFPARSTSSSSLGVLLFFLLMVCGSVANAQSAALGGVVMDPSSAMVRDAQVTVTNQRTSVSLHTKTNGSGLYSIPFIQPGPYTLTVEAPGFKRYERTGISIETAQTVAIDIKLQIGDSAQSVTVDGSGSYINTTDASVSTVIDRQFVENIPLNGRSFQSLITMVPGVMVVPVSANGPSGEFSVNGQRAESNYFTVDGVSANTGALPNSGGNLGVGAGFAGSAAGETALGTTQSLVSIDALQEFRATTSTYSAEYGRTPGGQFTFQTRSGTNDWHGSVFDYFRNDALDANNYFNKRTVPITPRQAERQNDFGGTLGGPIRIPGLYNGKDRTFFFFSYEGLRLRLPQAATLTEVPSMSLRTSAPTQMQAFLNAFPIPNGNDLGNGLANFTGGYSAPSSVDTSGIRIDHHFGDKFQLFGRYSDVPSSSQSRGTTGNSEMAVVTAQSVDVKSLTLGSTNTFTSKLTSDLRFNFTWNQAASEPTTDSYGGATPLSSALLNGIPGYQQGRWVRFLLNYGDFLPGLQLYPQSNNQHQLNIVETMNATAGKHQLRWGIDYRRLLTEGFYPSLRQQAVYTSASAVQTNQAQISAVLGPTQMKPIYTNLSAFLQDDWKITSRLSVSIGLRWELNPAPTDANGNNPYTITSTNVATLQLAPRNTPLWQTTYNNFAPRFGIAYQIHQQPGRETVLRIGSGIFYDTGNAAYASVGYQGQGLSSSKTFTGASFPLTQAQIDSIPAPTVQPPYQTSVYGFDPNLKLPYSWQWNLAVEQALGSQQTLTLSYVGSAGRRLQLRRLLYLLNNPYFPSSGSLYLTTNGATADYDALQVQFQRKMSHGLQALASYSWSHALDDETSNFGSTDVLRADSDVDIRNNFQLGVDYEVPAKYDNRLLTAALSNWSLDARITSRSALPVDVVGTYTVNADGYYVSYSPDRVPGQPLYVHDPAAPEGRAINFKAYQSAKDGAGNTIQGDAGRNSARGFGATQADIALSRTFPLTERVRLQFRAEAFNLFNQALMGTIYNTLSSGVGKFGYAYKTENSQLGGLNSLYQVGGPRSLQLALKLHF